jgi:hypothetical protein
MPADNDPRYNFDAGPSFNDISVLHGNFWPEEERIEDFLAALHEWRGHKRVDPAASPAVSAGQRCLQ